MTTLDQLRYFTAVATYQHVGRAALSVAISPSVISSAISTLEEELKCELFRKRGRGIELTADGERLLERSKSILTSVDALKAEMKHEPVSLSGKLRLGASHFLAPRLLLQGWNALTEKHPKLVGDLFSMNTADAINDVLSGRLDLALCFSPLKHPDLKEQIIYEGQLVFAVRKKHPIVLKSRSEQIRFLGESPAVIHKSSQGVDVCETHPLFDKLGFQPRIHLFFDSDDTAVQSLASSDMWSFLPDVVIHEHKEKIQALSLGPAPYHISTLIRRERANEPALRALCQSFTV